MPATRASLLVRLRDPCDETAWREFVTLYGPLKSFRCNELGHLCDNASGMLVPPPKNGGVSNLQGCVSNETSTGMLTTPA